MTRSRIPCGFTLMELLVAMSLMVVTSACLYSSLYTGFRAKRSAERAILPLLYAQSAIDMVVADLRGAVEPNTVLAWAFEGTNDRDGSNRDTDRVRLTSRTHEINGEPTRITCGMGGIELALVRSEASESYQLVRWVTDNLLAVQTTTPVKEILCRGVYAFNLRYFDGSAWTDAWDSADHQDTLPLAVEVTLSLEPQDQDVRSGRQQISRYDPAYRSRICQQTQIFTLPCGRSEDAIETSQSGQATGQGTL